MPRLPSQDSDAFDRDAADIMRIIRRSSQAPAKRLPEARKKKLLLHLRAALNLLIDHTSPNGASARS